MSVHRGMKYVRRVNIRLTIERLLDSTFDAVVLILSKKKFPAPHFILLHSTTSEKAEDPRLAKRSLPIDARTVPMTRKPKTEARYVIFLGEYWSILPILICSRVWCLNQILPTYWVRFGRHHQVNLVRNLTRANEPEIPTAEACQTGMITYLYCNQIEPKMLASFLPHIVR